MAGTIQVDELIAALGYEIDDKDLKAFKKGTDTAGVSTVALGSIVAGATTKLASMGVAAAKAAIAFTKDLVLGTAETADEIAKASKQLAVNAEQLQRVRGAAQLSGSSIQTLNRGISTFTVGLSDAKLKGTGPIIEALDVLGLSVEDLEGDLVAGDIERALGKIGDAFNETGEGAEKNGALLKLFGAKAGRELRPLLEEGTAGIRSLGDEISATGGVIGTDALPKFEEMQDQLLLIDQVAFGLKATIAEALAPEISNISEEFREWVLENDELVKQDIPELFRLMLSLLKELVPLLADTTKEINAMAGAGEHNNSVWADFVGWIGDAIDLVADLEFAIDKLILKIDEATPGIAKLLLGGEGAIEARAAVEKMEAVGEEADVGKAIKEAREQVRVDELTQTAIEGQKRSTEILIQTIKDIETAAIPARKRQLEEAIKTNQKLTVAEKKEAQQLGITIKGGGGGRGGGGRGKAKPQTLLGALGIDDGTAVSGAPAGGGASPLAGASFTNIDASLTINLGGVAVSSETIEEGVSQAVRKSPVWREIFDHYQEALPGQG